MAGGCGDGRLDYQRRELENRLVEIEAEKLELEDQLLQSVGVTKGGVVGGVGGKGAKKSSSLSSSETVEELQEINANLKEVGRQAGAALCC